jgi:soluble lytic murein transglycosylase-like protein
VVVVLSFLLPCQADVVINLAAIKTIESDGNPYALNQRTNCYGLYQISKVCLQDFNQSHKTNYASQDLFDPRINETVAKWYFQEVKRMLNHYEIPISLDTIIAAYNWGIGNVVNWYDNGADFTQLPLETRSYIEKYQRITTAAAK